MDGKKALDWWKAKFDAALKPRPMRKREPSIYASFNERMMASAIDITVLFMILNRPAQAMSAKLYETLPPEARAALSQNQNIAELLETATSSGFLTLYIVNFIVQVVLIGILIVTFQSLVHTTPGKWIVGLRITRSDNETFPSTGRLIVRYIGYIISCTPLMLGFIWMNFDPQRRTWHDRLAGTRVITTRPQGWYWAQTKKLFRQLKDRG